MSTMVGLFRHGVARKDGTLPTPGERALVFETEHVQCVVQPGPYSPLWEPLAEGEYFYVEIGKARHDDKPIPVEHDRRQAERDGVPYVPEGAAVAKLDDLTDEERSVWAAAFGAAFATEAPGDAAAVANMAVEKFRELP